MGGPPEAHQLSTALIFEALRTILDVIAPRGAVRAPAPPALARALMRDRHRYPAQRAGR